MFWLGLGLFICWSIVNNIMVKLVCKVYQYKTSQYRFWVFNTFSLLTCFSTAIIYQYLAMNQQYMIDGISYGFIWWSLGTMIDLYMDVDKKF